MGKPRKLKKKKDPLAPKGPLSSYLEFCKEERPKLLNDRGALPLVEVGRELGLRWKQVDKDSKAIFEKKALENRVKFEQEMAEYNRKKESSALSMDLLMKSAEEPGDATTEPGDATSAPGDATTEPGDASIDPCAASSVPGEAATETGDIEAALSASPAVQLPSSSIKAADLGFAKQKGYSWHPALKTGENKTGTRIRVTYFGSGQTGTVDKNKWIMFSKKVEEMLTTPKLKKYSSSTSGLNQLKILEAKIQNSEGRISNPGIPFTSQSGDRRLGRLSKDGLQKEEEENRRMMKEKIVERDGSPNKWGCRDCPWKGKFSIKAKGHARVCGLRRRENVRKPKEDKHECSGDDCSLSFPLLSQLYEHYR